MTNALLRPALDAVDVRHLYYFAVVAEENNLRRAAERLFMAQPPLSRQIKQLEERLGLVLFVRHSKGLTLTDDGAKVLEIIQPLLQMKKATYERLRQEVRPKGRSLSLGFTTAFEQGTFAELETRLRYVYGNGLHIHRKTSPKLVSDMRKGRLDVAIVALPLDAPGLHVLELAYAEPLVAAIPAVWLDSEKLSRKAIALKDFNEKPLFWFRREANPAFFDFAKTRFAQAGFAPCFIEEPAEHDVLLARIASGEGISLFAASFAAIKRDGVVFSRLQENEELRLQMGVISLSDKSDVAGLVAESFQPFWYDLSCHFP